MIFSLLRRRPSAAQDAAARLHAAAVAAARRPELFREVGAPDTLPGRFELVVLHAALILRRLRRESAAGAAIGQALFDATFRALDANLRELGVGDLAVPKRMKAMARAFFDGAKAYDAALDGGDAAALEEALRRIVFAGAPADARSPLRLAAYVERSEAALAGQSFDDLVERGPAFPAVVEEENQ